MFLDTDKILSTDKMYKFQGLRMKYERRTCYYVFFRFIENDKVRKFKINSSNYVLIKEIKHSPLAEQRAEQLAEQRAEQRAAQRELKKQNEKLQQIKTEYEKKFEQIEKFEMLRDYMTTRDVSLTDILHLNLIHDKQKYYKNFYKFKAQRNKICHPSKIEKIKSAKDFLKILT